LGIFVSLFDAVCLPWQPYVARQERRSAWIEAAALNEGRPVWQLDSGALARTAITCNYPVMAGSVSMTPGRKGRRFAGALSVALVHCLASYALVQWVSLTGLVSVTFLLVQPAAVSAFACYVTDLDGTQSRNHYIITPTVLVFVAMGVAGIFLREGVICVVMLLPLWLMLAISGGLIARASRKRGPDYSTVFSPAFLCLPPVMMMLEPTVLPATWSSHEVTRRIDVAASAARIWPLLEGIPQLRAGEGRWNLSQDLLGVPRPLGARLVGDGPGAIRQARWQRGVHFNEVVTNWQPGRAIGWRFDFAGSDGWQFTDPHLRPDSPWFQVTDGGYRLLPLHNGDQRVILSTRYRVRTPVNAYAALWGQLFLGDMENNLLATIKARAETR
jgi:hypothetical protein